jgi:hypothetical protein
MTLTLSAVGAVVGAVLGGLAMCGLAIAIGNPRALENGGLTGAAGLGAAVGAVLAPMAAWTLMRHVPIWRAILETAVGTALGAAFGAALGWAAGVIPGLGAFWPLVFGLVGFTAAALRLRLTGETAERAFSDSDASRAASRTAAVALTALLLTLASSAVPGTRLEVQDWDCPPAPASCARLVVAAGFPFPYISDHHGLSPGGHADLVGALLGLDRFRAGAFVANLAVYGAAVAAIALAWTRARRRRS